MKKIAALTLLFLMVFANANASRIQAYLSYAVFNTPDNHPYIETYFVVRGSSLQHIAMEDGSYQGKLNVQVIFRRNDSIVNFGKYGLTGPKVNDTSNITANLLDVQRYSLPEGDYILELLISDPNSLSDTVVSKDAFTIDFSDKEMNFSDIEFLHAYSKSDGEGILVKNGYNLSPYVFNFFPESVSELSFYAESYNSDKVLGNDQFILYYYIRPLEVDKKLDQYFFMKKQNAQPVNVLLKSIEISQLPSGNYLLVLETRNRENKLLAKKEIFFQRQNENVEVNLNQMLVANVDNTFAGLITSRDSLVLYIDYLYPISTHSQKIFTQSLFANGSIDELQKYFYSFWLNQNEIYPEKTWEGYHALVKKVNYEYKVLKMPGYKSDRGRVYLQYGPPNTIVHSYTEPEAFPYEIWHYQELNGQRDKRFVFYTREIATNDFQLIHSTAIGELPNYRWETIIHERASDWKKPYYDVDAAVPPNWYGSFSTDYYLMPR